MKFQKGQSVIAKDCYGNPHRMKVWKESKNGVFVASCELFDALEKGEVDRWPVSIPKEDLTIYADK